MYKWWKESDDEFSDDDNKWPAWEYNGWKKNKSTRGGKKSGKALVKKPRKPAQKSVVNQALSVLSSAVSTAGRFLGVLDDDDDSRDGEILFGSLRGEIVGLRYYKGVVNNNEMVSLTREPNNAYDSNAVKVTNVVGDQVGHIKRELARALAFIIDRNLARVEGTVPFGAHNKFTMPVDLSFWGQMDKKNEVVTKLKQSGFFISDGSLEVGSGSRGGLGLSQPHRTQLSGDQIKSELDKLFENLDEGDKATEVNPCEAVSTKLFSHQKQALGWMMRMENDNNLPPFWEEKPGPLYFNSITLSTVKTRPAPVRGGMFTLSILMRRKVMYAFSEFAGIVADDMGLGKTLTVIALVLTNFEKNQPLCTPVPGFVRASKKAKLKRLEAYRHSVGRKFCSGSLEMPCEEDDGSSFLSKDQGVRKRLPIKNSKSSTSRLSVQEIEDLTNSTLAEEEPKVVIATQKSSVRGRGRGRSRGRGSTVNRKLNDQEWDPAPEVKKGKITVKPAENTETRATGRPSRVSRKPVRYREVNESDEEQEAEQEQESKSLPVKTKKAVKPVSVDSCIAIENDDCAIVCEEVVETSAAEVICESSQPQESTSHNNNATECMSENVMTVELDDELPDVHEEVCVVTSESVSVIPDVKPSTSKSVTSHPPVKLSKEISDEAEVGEGEFDLPDLVLLNIPEPTESVKFGKSTGRIKGKGPRVTLIVCPLSTLGNWLDQFEEHVDERVKLHIYTYYGSSRTADVKFLSDQDVVITTYQTLSGDVKHEGPLSKIHWLRIVLDEGHTIRNPAAQMTKMIMSLKTERKWVVTGTPIQNSLKDLWSLIRFIGIEPFSEKHWWHRIIERPLAYQSDAALKRIQALLNSISIRRLKTQERNGKPIVSLPTKQIYLEKIELPDEEREMYDAMQKEGRIVVSKYFAEGTLLHHYGDVLAIMMRLRQMCCHPLLIAKAAKAAKEILDASSTENLAPDEFRASLIAKIMLVLGSGSDEECAICLDQLKSPVITHCAHLFCRACIEAVITTESRDNGKAKCPMCRGEVTVDKLVEAPPEQMNEEPEPPISTWQSSAKVDAVMSALSRLRAENPSIKSLVVSQFTSFLRLLEVPLKQNGFHYVRLDGTMSNKQRSSAIEIFSDSAPGSPSIMLLSLKAGGVGLNLTAASRVFLLDPAWNPASEEQCFDRCHRIGQTKDVVITKYVVENSVEERMLDLQERKRKLAQGVFSGLGKKPSAEEKRNNLIADIKTLIDL